MKWGFSGFMTDFASPSLNEMAQEPQVAAEEDLEEILFQFAYLS